MFLPVMHIPPGLFTDHLLPENATEHDRTEQRWHSNFTQRYIAMMKKYEDYVPLTVAGHVMKGFLRAAQSEVGDRHIIFGSPAVSPSQSTNPAFTIIDFTPPVMDDEDDEQLVADVTDKT